MPQSRHPLRLLATVALLAVSACDTTTPARPDAPVQGSISGSVRIEGAGLAGIQVALTGPVAGSATTDAAGRFRFDGLDQGSYVVSVTGLPDDADFPAATAAVDISRAQSSGVADFAGTWVRDAAISVTVRIDGVAFESATVSLQGPESASGTTDAAGAVSFDGLRRGVWQVALGGYDPLLYDFPTPTLSVDASAPGLREVTFEGTELPQVPAAPTGLVAAAAGSDAIELTWGDLSDDEDRFEIERRGPGDPWSVLHSVAAGVTSYTDGGLDPAATWTYRVRACNVAGCSDPTNEAEATTDDVPPVAPLDVAAAATGPTSARLTWTDASNNETGFEVERRVAASGGAGAGVWIDANSPGVDATAFDDLGLNPSTTYDYRVRACNDLGCSDWATGASATTDDVPPAAPTNPAAVVTGSTSLRLTWTDASDNENTFEVERRQATSDPWTTAGTASADETQWDDAGLLVTTEYGYRVRACNAAGCSDWSAEARGTTADVPPLAPTSLAATAAGENAIDLAWVDASANETRFELQRSSNGSSWSSLATLPAGSTVYSNTGLASGTTRHYRVRACNAEGCSAWSNAVSATTDLDPPSAPTSLGASSGGETTIDLGWNDTSDNEENFELQRSPNGSGSWSALTTLPGGTESHVDTGLSASETWYYRVRACNAAGCSGWSNIASATTDAPGPGGPNLSIAAVYINQRIQRLAGDVPLVADMDGYLRVFALADEPNSLTPDVRVDFYLGGGLAHSETLSAPAGSVPESVDESSLNASWNVLVPGSLIQPGLEIEVVVDPANAIAESQESDNAWPGGGGRESLDVRDTPSLDVTFVPVRQTVNGTVGDVNGGNVGNFMEETLAMMPFADADVQVRAEYSTDSPAVTSGDGSTWSTILSEINALRSLDGSSRYYYGVLEVTYGGGIAGMGYIGFPVSVGWDKSGSAGGIVAHEFGHNLGRRHSPGCGASNPDAGYPHASGRIGHWGLHVPSLSLRSPSTYHDFMTYCGPEWISDYVFEEILDRVAPSPFVGATSAFSASASAFPGKVRTGPAEPGLLLWGRIEGGDLILEPALEVNAPASPVSGGAYTLRGRDAEGGTLFSLAFDPIMVADGDGDESHFAFVVPLRSFDRDALAEIRLDGPDAPVSEIRTASVAPAAAPGAALAAVNRVAATRAEVTWNPAAYPMVVVRDADTGEVLTLGRSGRVQVAPGSSRVELEFSNGLRTVEKIVREWR